MPVGITKRGEAMTKLGSILKFVYAKGMENYIKYHRTEADGLKVVNQAIEQIKAMIPEERDINYYSTKKCSICGAEDLLHRAETNQCPKNGYEASIGKKQEWEMTVFTQDSVTTGKTLGFNDAIRQINEKMDEVVK